MHFYLLGLTGTLLYLYMVAVAVLVQFMVDENDLAEGFRSVPAARWGWGVFAAVSGWIAFSFVALTGFHTYLLCIGMGTFDWVVLQVSKKNSNWKGRKSCGYICVSCVFVLIYCFLWSLVGLRNGGVGILFFFSFVSEHFSAPPMSSTPAPRTILTVGIFRPYSAFPSREVIRE